MVKALGFWTVRSWVQVPSYANSIWYLESLGKFCTPVHRLCKWEPGSTQRKLLYVDHPWDSIVCIQGCMLHWRVEKVLVCICVPGVTICQVLLSLFRNKPLYIRTAHYYLGRTSDWVLKELGSQTQYCECASCRTLSLQYLQSLGKISTQNMVHFTQP